MTAAMARCFIGAYVNVRASMLRYSVRRCPHCLSPRGQSRKRRAVQGRKKPWTFRWFLMAVVQPNCGCRAPRTLMNLTRIDTVSYSAAHIVDFRVREEGANPSRSRRCQWGRNPPTPLSGSTDGKGRGVGRTMSQKTCPEN